MTTEENKTELVEFDNVNDALDHLENLQKEATDAVGRYHQALYEFAGVKAGQQVSPVDIVKMILRFKDAK